MNTLTPIAIWPGHGTILADTHRLKYRSDARPRAPEDWPEPGSTLRAKVRRLLSGGDCVLVPCEGLGAEVAAELERERAATRAAELEAQSRREQAAAAELKRRGDLRLLVLPLTTGWRRGEATYSCGDGVGRVGRGFLAPFAGWAVIRVEGLDEWSLTHTGSGLRAASGSLADLKVLAARLHLASPWTSGDPTREAVKAWGRVVVPFRQTGDCWTAEKELA